MNFWEEVEQDDGRSRGCSTTRRDFFIQLSISSRLHLQIGKVVKTPIDHLLGKNVKLDAEPVNFLKRLTRLWFWLKGSK